MSGSEQGSSARLRTSQQRYPIGDAAARAAGTSAGSRWPAVIYSVVYFQRRGAGLSTAAVIGRRSPPLRPPPEARSSSLPPPAVPPVTITGRAREGFG